MFLTLSLPAVSFLLLLIISGITLFSLYFIKDLTPRILLLISSLVFIPFTFFIINIILGNPRPIENYLHLDEKKYQLISVYYIEEKNIYLWLLPSEGENKDPVYFILPWSVPEAKKLVMLMEAQKNGATVDVTLKPTEFPLIKGEYNPGERIEYKVKLPPPMPPKTQ